MYNVSFVNVNVTLICNNILYISKSNVALCSIYHYNTLSICICCINIHTNVTILVIVDPIFYVTWSYFTYCRFQNAMHVSDMKKIKTVAPMLTRIKIVAHMHMVGIDLVGRPCNVNSTDVILTQCNVDYCQCTDPWHFGKGHFGNGHFGNRHFGNRTFR